MHGGWPQAEIAIASVHRTEKNESLPLVHVEVEDYLLHSLYWGRSIFPLHERFGGKFSEHRVAAFDLDTGDIAVGQHSRFCDNACLKVAIPEEIRVFRLDSDNHLTGSFARRLSKYVLGLDRYHEKHQCSNGEKLADPGKVAECAITEIHLGDP
jgi:hypothetical protein